MGKNFLILMLSTIFFGSLVTTSAALNIDLSNSRTEIQTTDTLRVRGISVEGYSEKYWVDIQWNPESLSMVPVNVGVEPFKTCAFTIPGSDTASANIAFGTDPVYGAITLVIQGVSGTTSFSYGNWVFIQGSNQFDLQKNPAYVDPDSALFQPLDGWDGTGYIYADVVRRAVITDLPSWFDFSGSFKISYKGSSPAECQ